MTEQPDTTRATILSAADFDRLLVDLDDDPMSPETAAGLAGLRDRPDVFGSADDEPAEPNPRIQAAVAEMRAERTPTPERDGYTVGVYLPAGVSDTIRERLFDAIADATHAAGDGQGWDAHVVGVPGDPLGAVSAPDAEDQAYEEAMRARRRGGED